MPFTLLFSLLGTSCSPSKHYAAFKAQLKVHLLHGALLDYPILLPIFFLILSWQHLL